jgi:hypothetical protein
VIGGWKRATDRIEISQKQQFAPSEVRCDLLLRLQGQQIYRTAMRIRTWGFCAMLKEMRRFPENKEGTSKAPTPLFKLLITNDPA